MGLMSDDLRVEPGTDSSDGWLVWQAIQIRLRFILLVGILAIMALLWPWMSSGWSRILVRFNPPMMGTAVSANNEFFCPMDPGVVSVWPAICPICNMDLITRTKGDAILLPTGVIARMQISPYRIALAGVRTVAIEERVTINNLEKRSLLVPLTSIVYREDETLIYVERAPGMIDGVKVSLGDRIDDYYEIIDGEVSAGQRVVAMGTLLMDAESRLNPNLTTQYFGASDRLSAATPPPTAKRPASPDRSLATLNPNDRAIVELQRYCPVTLERLGSMGTPLFVSIGERKVAICCEGCRGSLEKEPDKYLGGLEEKLSDERSPK